VRFDSLVLSAITKEIKEEALNRRVENIYQPSPLTIVFSMVFASDILISIEPNEERIHLTDRKYPHPQTPPSFCMQLRKYIRGSFLKEVEQVEWERIARFRFSSGAELIVEIMGRHSNVILVEEGVIRGALKLIDEKLSSKRQILPGLPYQLPPTFTRKNPLYLSREEMREDLSKEEGELGKVLMKLYQGMSPFLISEIAQRAGLSPEKNLPLSEAEFERIYEAWEGISQMIREGKFQPIIIKQEGNLIGYWAVQSVQPYDFEERGKMSDAVEEFHLLQEREAKFRALKDSMKEEIEGEMEKWRKVKESCERALEEWGNVERFYQMGSLILSNLRLIKKGMESVTLENIFDEERRKITIPLSKELTPQQNADKYFQLYRKGKKAVEELKERIRKAEEELKVLEERYEKVMRSESLEELEALKEGKELEKEEKKKPMLPSVRSSDGFLIQYGKNARQNELLLKTSSPDDIWLHARGAKGAHIVIRREGKKEVPMRTIREAAQLAAYLSSARGAGVVPVDWTLRKYVRKPKKREKGFVIYTREKTIFVEPALIESEEKEEK
jgi:predicted ribosome quality control (RQC) complex YloA/Tae2 family protein